MSNNLFVSALSVSLKKRRIIPVLTIVLTITLVATLSGCHVPLNSTGRPVDPEIVPLGSTEQQRVSPTNQVASDGGADGGGGDAQGLDRLPLETLEQFFETPRFYLLPVLHSREIFAWSIGPEPYIKKHDRGEQAKDPLLRRALVRLFPRDESKNVFSELKRVTIKLRKDGACKDLRHEDHDASAFNEDPLEICVSAERILPKLTTRNYIAELTALLGHELVHRLGGNEEEAVAFQDFVRRTSRLGALELFMESPAILMLHSAIDKIRETHNSLRTAIIQFEEGKARPCREIEEFFWLLYGVAQRSNSKGVATFRAPAEFAITAAVVQAKQLRNYCLLEDGRELEYERLPLERAISVRAFVEGDEKRYGPSGVLEKSIFEEKHGLIQLIPYLDHELLKFNFVEMERNIQAFLKIVAESKEQRFRDRPAEAVSPSAPESEPVNGQTR